MYAFELFKHRHRPGVCKSAGRLIKRERRHITKGRPDFVQMSSSCRRSQKNLYLTCSTRTSPCQINQQTTYMSAPRMATKTTSDITCNVHSISRPLEMTGSFGTLYQVRHSNVQIYFKESSIFSTEKGIDRTFSLQLTNVQSSRRKKQNVDTCTYISVYRRTLTS